MQLVRKCEVSFLYDYYYFLNLMVIHDSYALATYHIPVFRSIFVLILIMRRQSAFTRRLRVYTVFVLSQLQFYNFSSVRFVASFSLSVAHSQREDYPLYGGTVTYNRSRPGVLNTTTTLTESISRVTTFLFLHTNSCFTRLVGTRHSRLFFNVDVFRR